MNSELMVRPKPVTAIILLLTLLIGAFLLFRPVERVASPSADGADVGSSERSEGRAAGVPEETALPGLRLHFSNAYANDPSIGEGDPLNIDRQLVRFIRGAERTIDAAFFELESPRIAEALLDALSRGVRVRLVLEDDYAGNEVVGILRDEGIPIVTDERSGLMHNKFVVVDGRRVWTGSVNATDNGAWRNNNHGLEIDSREIAENYAAEFREMFEDRSFGPRSPSRTPHTLVTIGDVAIYNYFAPEDDVQTKILRYLRLAKKQIRFMAFSFTDDEIGSLMVERFAEGIDVAGVLETRGSSLDYSELGRFRAAGLPVLTDANRYVMHHKVIVIDSLWTILGSYNFSASANRRNDENIVIIKSAAIAGAMLEEYERVAAMEVR